METNLFIAVFYIMFTSGQIGVVHEGIPYAERMSSEQCVKTIQRRLEAENKKPAHLWVGAECIPVPPVPGHTPVPNAPEQKQPQAAPDMNNPRQMENT